MPAPSVLWRSFYGAVCACLHPSVHLEALLTRYATEVNASHFGVKRGPIP